MKLPSVLKQFLFQSAFWTALCLGCEIVARFGFHLGLLYTYPAGNPADHFGDFNIWKPLFLHFHSRNFFHQRMLLMYPAPVAVWYKIFLFNPFGAESARFITWRFIAIILFTSWFMLICLRGALIQRGLARRSATIFVTLTYLFCFPFWFDVHQGNMEFLVWILVTLGIWGFWNERPWIAAAAFGLAAAMKIFPFVFLGLLIARKQYRQALFSAFVVVITNIACLWLVCPDVPYAWRQTSMALNGFREAYMLHILLFETGIDHSMFALFKRSASLIHPKLSMALPLNIYLAVVAVAGCICFFTKIRKLPKINQILCLSVASILLPPTSFEYTLMELLPAFAVLVFAAISKQPGDSLPPRSQRGLTISFALMAFLFSVQAEFIYRQAAFGGQLKCLALLTLWIVAMIYPFEQPAPLAQSSQPMSPEAILR